MRKRRDFGQKGIPFEKKKRRFRGKKNTRATYEHGKTKGPEDTAQRRNGVTAGIKLRRRRSGRPPGTGWLNEKEGERR